MNDLKFIQFSRILKIFENLKEITNIVNTNENKAKVNELIINFEENLQGPISITTSILSEQLNILQQMHTIIRTSTSENREE
jgi:hypothetical protein